MTVTESSVPMRTNALGAKGWVALSEAEVPRSVSLCGNLVPLWNVGADEQAAAESSP